MAVSVTRERRCGKPVLAICYDFDKTLAPGEMQAQGFIQSVGYEDVDDFWSDSNDLSVKNDMDPNLAYMLLMILKSKEYGGLTKKGLREYGSRLKLFKGVEDWFPRITRYGEEKGIAVEHYVISSGIKEIIEGTSVAGEFKRIFASSFYYDENGDAVWPAQSVNYTNKTQFLFRIEKGFLSVNDPGVNDSVPEDRLRIKFRNIVYIGDSDTDVPCMKLVNERGGHSICVFDKKVKDKALVYKMMREKRIHFFVPADYREKSEMDNLIKSVIDDTAAHEVLEKIHDKCRKRTLEEEQKR